MSSYYIGSVPFSAGNHLQHYGILGMKWGVRRYQNPDGTLTAEGKNRYKSSGQIISDNASNIHNRRSDKNTSDKATSELRKISNDVRSQKSVKKSIKSYKEASEQLSVSKEFGLRNKDDQDRYNVSVDNLRKTMAPFVSNILGEYGNRTFNNYADVNLSVKDYVLDNLMADASFFWDKKY